MTSLGVRPRVADQLTQIRNPDAPLPGRVELLFALKECRGLQAEELAQLRAAEVDLAERLARSPRGEVRTREFVYRPRPGGRITRVLPT